MKSHSAIETAQLLHNKQTQYFNSASTLPLSWRKHQLKQIMRMLKQEESVLLKALHDDLGKSPTDSYLAEIGFLKSEIKEALKHLSDWTREQKVSTPYYNMPASSWICPQPKGVVLIIGPWNYPLQLMMGPAIAAIAAGNCMILKPSEHSPRFSAVLADILPRYLDTNAITVMEGNSQVAEALLAQRFDHIFFTGGTKIGQLVMQKAAANLVPVTLELGGKSPCIVDETASIELAAKRIAWGKFLNCGQTCIAPDYLFVHKSVHDQFVESLKKTITQFFGKDPRQSPDYGRIVNQNHTQRLANLLPGERIVMGGEHDIEARYMAPTLLAPKSKNTPIMQDEIFGPLLPMFSYSDWKEPLEYIKQQPRPLALYLFSSNAKHKKEVVSHTHSGGISINDTLTHCTVPQLPFGGIGPSGIGAYHGKFGFDVFTHYKAVYERSTLVDIPLRYPPHSEQKLALLRRLM